MYQGETYQIPCDRGGLNNNRNIDLIPPEGMMDGSKNINLDKGGREKRGGTEVVNSSVISGTPRITGMHQFIKEDGNVYVLVAAKGPIIRYDNVSGAADFANDITNSTWDTDTSNIVNMITAADTVFICNGYDTPQTTTDPTAGNTADITTPAADWVDDSNNPKGMSVRTRVLDAALTGSRAEKLWAWGCPSNPNRLYFSSTFAGSVANLKEFSGGTSGNLDVITGHGEGIIRVIEWGQRHFAFSKINPYVIDDRADSSSHWGTHMAQWGTGIGSQRLIAKTNNDLVAMAEDGEVYSVLTAEQYGDYKQASLTRGSYMHEWIEDNLDVENIDDCHMIYDPSLRAIKIFIRRKTVSYVDTALVYFVDRPQEEAWIIHDFQDTAAAGDKSGYHAACSAVIKHSSNPVYRVYTGGWTDGYIHRLEASTKSDNSNAYSAGFKTPRLPFGNPRMEKRYDRVRVVVEPEGSYNLDLAWWVDGVTQEAQTFDLTPDGSFVLGTSTLGGTSTESTLSFVNGEYEPTLAGLTLYGLTSAAEGTIVSSSGSDKDMQIVGGTIAGGNAKGAFTIENVAGLPWTAGEDIMVDVLGTPTKVGEFLEYGSGTGAALGGDTLIDSVSELGAVGRRIQFEVTNNRAGEDFFVSQLLIDFQPLGKNA